MFPKSLERSESRARVGVGMRTMIEAGLALGCVLRDAVGVTLLHRLVLAPVVVKPGILPPVKGADGSERSPRSFREDDVGDRVLRDALDLAVCELAPVLAAAGLRPVLAVPDGVDARDLEVKTLESWFRSWTARFVAALEGAADRWAAAVRRLNAEGVRSAIEAGAIRAKDWRASFAAALKGVGIRGASDTVIDATVRDLVAKRQPVLTCRGNGGRLVPDFRGLRDSGALGKRRRPSRAKPRVAPPTSESGNPASATAEARSLARVELVEVLERVERLGKVGRLGARDVEMMTLSASIGFDGFGGRSHCRALNAAGFKISQPGLLKMARRVRKALRAG